LAKTFHLRRTSPLCPPGVPSFLSIQKGAFISLVSLRLKKVWATSLATSRSTECVWTGSQHRISLRPGLSGRTEVWRVRLSRRSEWIGVKVPAGVRLLRPPIALIRRLVVDAPRSAHQPLGPCTHSALPQSGNPDAQKTQSDQTRWLAPLIWINRTPIRRTLPSPYLSPGCSPKPVERL